jgi:hypothetical protein
MFSIPNVLPTALSGRMQTTLYGTIVALALLGTAAAAERPETPCTDASGLSGGDAPSVPGANEPAQPSPGPSGISDEELAKLAEQEARTEVIPVTGVNVRYRRGVAQDYFVIPDGGEISGSLRFLVTPQAALGTKALRFSDLALFELAGRWSIGPSLELSGQVALLPKQPPDRDEKVWQSVGLGLHYPLGLQAAVALEGAGGHLIGHAGMWDKGSLGVQWRKPLNRLVRFEIAGGVDAIDVSAPHSTSALITEVAASGSTLFHDPSNEWGAWIGVAYAIPVFSRGTDPTTALAIDPQPRLDLRLGTVLAVVDAWDLFAEFAVIDRGDVSDPRTQLPILDGGFDQLQVVLGVTRHIQGKH